MTIIFKNEYPSLTNASNPNGTFINSSVAGALDGSPGDEKWSRDMWGFLSRLLLAAGITPNGFADSTLDSQVFDSLEILISTAINRINNLVSVDPNASLSAAQGPIITGLIQAVEALIPPKSIQAENEVGTNDTKFVSPLGIRQAFNAAGTPPLFACRAWVNFDGGAPPTPPSIRASGNVSGITDNGVGNYTVNFITDMEDTNYVVVATCGEPVNFNRLASTTNNYLVGSVQIITLNPAAATENDVAFINVAIFR